MTPTLKNLLIVCGVVAVGVAGYFYMNSTQTIVPVGGSVEDGGAVIGQDIVILAEKLNSIDLDTSVFSDPSITSLKDFNINLYTESQGRTNPFALIGVEAPIIGSRSSF